MLLKKRNKIVIDGVGLFPLFQWTCNSTLLYPFKTPIILRRTPSGFCTLPFGPANVYIVTFASPLIFSWPLVKNQRFSKTMQILVWFHHFRKWKKCIQFFFKNLSFFFKIVSRTLCYIYRLKTPFLQNVSFPLAIRTIQNHQKLLFIVQNTMILMNFDDFWSKNTYIYTQNEMTKSTICCPNQSIFIKIHHFASIWRIWFPTPSPKMDLGLFFPM